MSVKGRSFGKKSSGRNPVPRDRMQRLLATPAPSVQSGRIYRTQTAAESPLSAERLATLTKKANRVRQTRHSVYREGRVVYGSGYSRSGVIMDYSESGLRMRFPTHESLPTIVHVKAASVGIDGPARVVWHKGMEFGFHLVKAKQTRP